MINNTIAYYGDDIDKICLAITDEFVSVNALINKMLWDTQERFDAIENRVAILEEEDD